MPSSWGVAHKPLAPIKIFFGKSPNLPIQYHEARVTYILTRVVYKSHNNFIQRLANFTINKLTVKMKQNRLEPDKTFKTEQNGQNQSYSKPVVTC